MISDGGFSTPTALRSWIDRRIAAMLAVHPHNRAMGLTRTLIAAATAAALACTPTAHLFFVADSLPAGRVCQDLSADIGLFCVVGSPYLEWARWAAVAILVVTASGWRPRITVLPHWWVSWSFFSSSNAFDGGDQVAAVVCLLLVPIGLTDARRWHWQSPLRSRRANPAAQVVAHVCLRLIWIQASALYLHACIGKLGGAEWQNGTSLWYWVTSSSFGVPSYLSGPTRWLLSQGWAVLIATWGTLVIEFLLACSLLAGYHWRRAVLPFGLSLHLGIAVLMGLPVFSIIMCALLLLYLQRPGDPSTLRADLARWARRKPPLVQQVDPTLVPVQAREGPC